MSLRRAAVAGIATLLLAGCGSDAHGTSADSGGNPIYKTAEGRPVSSRDGSFGTVIPPGFSNATAQANTGVLNIQYAARARPVDGFATNINVIRSMVRVSTITELTQLELAQLHQQLRSSHHYSPVTSLQVAGAPARQVNYLALLNGRALRIRQIFVLHGAVAYTITYTALARRYHSGQRSMHEVLKGWHWT